MYAIRVILELTGVMLVVTSWLIRNRGVLVANALLIVGIFSIITGVLIRRATRLKRCPCCAEKVNRDASRCSFCSFEFPANIVESIARPFYK